MGRRFRVLVADDNEDAADTLAALLELNGYEVQVAYDGEAALRLAERWPPDAAVLDIRMPGRDGYDVARDYYVARHRDGGRLWIFRNRRDTDPAGWFLHGWFA